MSTNSQLNPCQAGTKRKRTEDTNLPPNEKPDETKKVKLDLDLVEPSTTLSAILNRIHQPCDCCPDWVYETSIPPDDDVDHDNNDDGDENEAILQFSSDQSTENHLVESQPAVGHPAERQPTENQHIKSQHIENEPAENQTIKNSPAESHLTASHPAAPSRALNSVTPSHLPPPHTAYFTTTAHAASQPAEHHPTSTQPLTGPRATPSPVAHRSSMRAAHFTSSHARLVERQPTKNPPIENQTIENAPSEAHPAASPPTAMPPTTPSPAPRSAMPAHLPRPQYAPHFTSASHARAHLRCLSARWRPPVPDASVPRTPDLQARHVRFCVAALTHVVERNGIDVDAARIEAGVWLLLDAAVRLHDEGCVVAEAKDGSMARGGQDRLAGFKARWLSVVKVVGRWSVATESVLRGQEGVLEALVAAPGTWLVKAEGEEMRRRAEALKGDRYVQHGQYWQ